MNESLIYALGALLWGLAGFVVGKGKRNYDQKALEAIGEDLPTLILDYEETKRKADEYFAKIEEVIAEREQWRDLYNDQAGGHDNAQGLMLRTITALVHQIKREGGKTPRIDPLIETARGEWVSEHGPEARKERGEDGRRKEDSEEKSD